VEEQEIVRALAPAAAAAWIPIRGPGSSDPLPGTAVAGLGLDTPRFPPLARLMGQLLVRFQTLPYDGLGLDDTWADPRRLADRARPWARAVGAGADVVGTLPELFAGRPAVLAHGDYTPANVVTDGTRLTCLLGFGSTRIADPLFDVAWWHWSVGLAPPRALELGWPAFLGGFWLRPDEPLLAERVRALQVVRMLELLAGPAPLHGDVAALVRARLQDALP
jgi:Ser/Thr protein kinase RdoA (MazF antagonist)